MPGFLYTVFGTIKEVTIGPTAHRAAQRPTTPQPARPRVPPPPAPARANPRQATLAPAVLAHAATQRHRHGR